MSNIGLQNITFKVISVEAKPRCLIPFKVMMRNQYYSYSILEMYISVSMHFTIVQIFLATPGDAISSDNVSIM